MTENKRNKERLFRMKRFSVSHSRSANKVGVDGVLIGAWSNVDSAGKILDAGCGCGLIALMLAQRNPDAIIKGIDIDPDAIEEAKLNISASDWSDRIIIEQQNFNDIREKFDLIVSNPPFFNDGIKDVGTSSRTLARHAGSLSPEVLISSSRYLNPDGRLSIIARAEDEESLISLASNNELSLKRRLRVKGNPQSRVKRVLLEFTYVPHKHQDSLIMKNEKGETKELIIENTPGNYTEDYIALCKDFYIKF